MERLRYQGLEAPRALLVAIYLAVAAWYLGWRLGTFNQEAYGFSLLVYGAEAFGMLTALMHIFMCWRLTERQAGAPRPGLSVDVFVPTYNESIDLVRKTLLAARDMHYPHATWLLDDGNRPQMRELAEKLGCRYLARADNAHAKAGNLNHALANSHGELVAVFDADHAPRRDFLLRTLAYFDDPAVAFVQTPQDFYNLDSYQHRWKGDGKTVWTEQSLFFRIIQRGKDYWNAAFFCGSCAVVRRSSLEAIGGFATETVTEDLHTSIRLHAKGFRSVYHAEPLAFGVAPESIQPFLSQRVRWGQGAMQVWRREGILFNRGLSFAQRINYFASALTYFDGWQKAILYFAPAVVLATGMMPLISTTQDFLLHFVPFYLLTFWVFEEVGRGFGRSLFIEQYNMTRFAAFIWGTFGLFAKRLRFRVTPKGEGRRLSIASVLPQLLVLALNLGAMPVGFLMFAHFQRLPIDGLVANVVWAGVNAALALAVLAFTRTANSFTRADYRFPVPLPATLVVRGQEEAFGTVDDISAEGFRFYGRLPKILARDEAVHGKIHLPQGEVTFSAKIKALVKQKTDDGGYVKAVGCQFDDAPQTREALESFLYGSDLQWRLNAFQEQGVTPLARLIPRLAPQPSRTVVERVRWAAARFYSGPAATAVKGVISTPGSGGERYALLFKFAGNEPWLRACASTRSGETEHLLVLKFHSRLDTASGSLFLYRVSSASGVRAGTTEESPAEVAVI